MNKMLVPLVWAELLSQQLPILLQFILIQPALRSKTELTSLAVLILLCHRKHLTVPVTQMAVQTKTNSQVFTPFNVYGSYQVNDQIVVGLGIYNPFGLGTQWPDKWGQALNGIYVGSASSVNASIATYYFNPTIAYKINDQLSVGLGVSYVYGTVSMSQTNPSPFGGYFKSQLDGTGNGFNANIGVMYKPTDQLSFGLSYRMTTKIDFSGNATFTNIDVPTTLYLPSPHIPQV